MQHCMKPHLLEKFAALLAVGVLPAVLAQPVLSQPTTPTRPAGTARPVPAPAIAQPAAKPATPAAAAKPAAAPIPANLTVAATVNGDKIMMTDVDVVATRIQQQQPGIPQEDLDNIKRQILEDLIVERLLVQEAKRGKHVPDEQRVNDAIWNYQKKFITQTAYLDHLKAGGKTEAELRRMLTEDIAVSLLSRDLTKDLTVNDAEIATFYNEHKSDFVEPETVHVRHIQISVKNDATAAERAQAKKRAEEALKKATANNADFAAHATEYSDDKVSVPYGGSLGFIARDDVIDKAFGDVVFTAPVGKVHNKIITTKFGYNILKIEEKKPSRTLALSEIKGDLKTVLMQRKIKAKLDSRVVELRNAADIKRNF